MVSAEMLMRIYLSPEKTHGSSGDWAFGTIIVTFSNPAAFNNFHPSVINFGLSRKLSFAAPARLVPTKCFVLVLWIWQNSV